jgi:hypothetical protein
MANGMSCCTCTSTSPLAQEPSHRTARQQREHCHVQL